jgi:hypothetical protein
MNDKPAAGLLTALAVVPIFVLCCLGPLVLGSAVIGGVAGWLAGWGGLAIVAAPLAVGAVSYALLVQAQARRDRAKISDAAKASL